MERSAVTFQACRSVLFSMVLLVSGFISSAQAHEPVFSLGPETIWQGGIGIETEFEFEDGGGEEMMVLHYEIIYGLTETLSLTLEVPQLLERKEDGETEHGVGDIEIRAKYQFFRNDMLGAQHKMIGIFGVKAPTGDHDAELNLGTGTTDFLFGGSYGYESRTWYHFLTTRYRWRTESGNRDPGDRLFIDGAIGYRPFQTKYTELDAVFLLEMNAEFEFKDELGGTRLPNTGGNTIWLGPIMLISPNPQWMFKGGIQFSIYEDLNGDQEHSEFRMMLGVGMAKSASSGGSTSGSRGGGGGGDISFFGDDEQEDELIATKEEMGQELAQLVRESIESDICQAHGGEYASVRFAMNRLIINAPKYVHRQIGIPTVA